MTKYELKDIINDAQDAARGCGCCAHEDEAFEARNRAVDLIWEEIKPKGPIVPIISPYSAGISEEQINRFVEEEPRIE